MNLMSHLVKKHFHNVYTFFARSIYLTKRLYLKRKTNEKNTSQ